MAVKLFHQERFERAPQKARMQEGEVIGNQCYVGGAAGFMDMV
jgi:hypothetical protein